MTTVALLFPLPAGRTPRPPEASAFGRASLLLALEGLDVVIGHTVSQRRLTGSRAVPGRWEAVTDVPIDAAVHRFPDGDRPEAWQRLHAELGGVPIVNPPTLVRLCRDKLACQRALESGGLALPEVVDTDLDGALRAWGAAFLKPREGAFGRGIRRVVPGDPLPADPEGWVLQRAIPAPEGWAGVSARVLVQRDPSGEWSALPAAVRAHRTDPVVNQARGAHVVAAEALLNPHTVQALSDDAVAAARVLAAGPDGPDAGELGVDLVIDREGKPWIVEVNAKPRGRLEVLARQDPDAFQAAHDAAVCRPIRWAARRAGWHPDPSAHPTG